MDLNTVKELIKKSRLEKALDLLSKIIEGEFPDNKRFLQKIIWLSNQQKYLSDKIRKGVISFENENLAKNRIVNELLELIREIEVKENTPVQVGKKKYELWRIFPNSFQIYLARKNIIKVEPPNDYQLYYYNKLGELFKKKSLGGKIQFVHLQERKAQEQKDEEKKQFFLSIACALYKTLFEFIENAREYSDKEKERVNHLMNKAINNFDEFICSLENQKIEKYKQRKKELVAISLKRLQKELKIEFRDRIVGIPNEYALGVFSDIVWAYCGYPSTGFKWMKKTGEIIKKGDPVLSIYGINIRSPINGVLINHHSYETRNCFWEMIPEKNYDTNESIGDLVYGELLEIIHDLIKKNFTTGRTDIDSLRLSYNEISGLKLVEVKLNDFAEEVLNELKK